MRRTVFVFPRDLLPAAWGSASARVAAAAAAPAGQGDRAGRHRRRRRGLARPRLRRRAGAAGRRQRAGGQAIREALPELDGRLELAAGKKYAANVSVSPRVLTQLGVEGLITRGRNGGHWRISRPQWTTMEAWLGRRRRSRGRPTRARPSWSRRWLWTFGPGTAADVQWWLGGTVGIVKQALATLGAEQVGARRRRDRLAAARRPRGGHPRRALGRPAARARPDRDGLEVARLLPRPARAAPLRQQRQRRHHRLVGRPDRRLLGAGRRRRGRAALRRQGPEGRREGAGRSRPTG